MANIGFIMNDLNNTFLISLLIFNQNVKIFVILSTFLFSSFIITSLINLLKHFYNAQKVLGSNAKDKVTYKHKNKKLK